MQGNQISLSFELYFHNIFKLVLCYGLVHLSCEGDTSLCKSPMHRYIPRMGDKESSPATLRGRNQSANHSQYGATLPVRSF